MSRNTRLIVKTSTVTKFNHKELISSNIEGFINSEQPYDDKYEILQSSVQNLKSSEVVNTEHQNKEQECEKNCDTLAEPVK